MYGYTDSNDVVNNTSGGKFGLNNKAYLTKFEYNPNGGKDGAQQDSIDITITIEDKEYRKRIFPFTKVYGKDNEEITDSNHPEFKKGLKLFNATLMDFVEIFTDKEVVKQALSTNITNFGDFAKILEELVKTDPNWNKKRLDVFLRYQFTIKGENNRTWLELPKNIKHGKHICAHIEGDFHPIKTSGLKYVDSEGNIHPFKRSEWFMGSNFANQIILEGDSSDDVFSSDSTGVDSDEW